MRASTVFSSFVLLALAGVAPALPLSPFRHHSAAVKASQKAKRDASSKLVVAHHIVGNTYPYTQADWLADINLAHESGLDGFALNVGPDSWQPARVADAYQAAENSGTGFKLFMSFDMSVLPCGDASDASALTSYITTYASHPNQLTMNGRVFASTFSGSDCTFGQSSAAEGWTTQFIDQLTGSNAVHFVPAFFVDTSSFSTFDGVMDGVFNWNGGWPTELSASGLSTDLAAAIFSSSIQSELNATIGSFASDSQYVSGLSSLSSSDNGTTFIAAVSPWFYTHYGKSSYNKNFIYLSDYHLYNNRWDTIIANRDSIDVVEVITWNDYGESHYIGPIEGAQPDSQDWVDGMDHTGWLAMTNYYATAFRTGAYPAITQDQLYLWARPHAKDASAWNDTIGPPTSYQLTEDLLWAVVFATEPGTVTLTTSSTSSSTVAVGAGVTQLLMDLADGAGMAGTLTRNGQTVLAVDPGDAYTFTTTPEFYNFNAFVAYATSG
ncbi:glycoside hydrolase family 71 protein [Laetiporus sulphureus 93-53]|uniref:Glycoside hydrolase family 71 protein n=1 Tax=Laetiporus sulphureus 93-53 TaxID=1314785 RepID=A0A165HQG6_9APHY|nr:glycoside hydrolase family 71 protein [Laetiporus sulphureus 93-53]KZT12051.1 glycoside hydrolase family 71 protein [Laetiporus sulphureus 93-53]